MTVFARRLPILLASFALASCASHLESKSTSLAVAHIFDAAGKRVGKADFHTFSEGVVIELSVAGLSAGEHGVHIHANGRCDAPDFMSAGPHLNPSKRAHGYHNPAGYHEGDLPNLIISDNGKGLLRARLPGTVEDITRALKDGDGRTIVIHANPDDMKTDPSGNSGTRIACGRIEVPLRTTGTGR